MSRPRRFVCAAAVAVGLLAALCGLRPCMAQNEASGARIAMPALPFATAASSEAITAEELLAGVVTRPPMMATPTDTPAAAASGLAGAAFAGARGMHKAVSRALASVGAPALNATGGGPARGHLATALGSCGMAAGPHSRVGSRQSAPDAAAPITVTVALAADGGVNAPDCGTGGAAPCATIAYAVQCRVTEHMGVAPPAGANCTTSSTPLQRRRLPDSDSTVTDQAAPLTGAVPVVVVAPGMYEEWGITVLTSLELRARDVVRGPFTDTTAAAALPSVTVGAAHGATAPDRILLVLNAPAFRIIGITVRGGANLQGGGIGMARSPLDVPSEWLLQDLLLASNHVTRAGGGGWAFGGGVGISIAGVITDMSVTVLRCGFVNNTSTDSSVIGGGLGIQVGDATGAAVSGLNLTVRDTAFHGNAADFGGGAGVWLGGPTTVNASTLTFHNVVWRHNTAQREGGGLLLELSGNAVDGEAVQPAGMLDTTMAWLGCTWESNDAPIGGGTALVAFAPAYIFQVIMAWQQCTWAGNTARVFGAGLAIATSGGSSMASDNVIVQESAFRWTDCEWAQNVGIGSCLVIGGMSAVYRTEFALHSSEFAYNTGVVGSAGGGLSVNVNVSAFVDNVNYGVHESSIAVVDTVFIDNEATQKGGGGGAALLLHNGSGIVDTTVQWTRCSFVGNSISAALGQWFKNIGGGGLLVSSDGAAMLRSPIAWIDCVFRDNIAQISIGGGGGALLALQNAALVDSPLSWERCTWVGNVGVGPDVTVSKPIGMGGGGGLALWQSLPEAPSAFAAFGAHRSLITCTSCNFTSNVARTVVKGVPASPATALRSMGGGGFSAALVIVHDSPFLCDLCTFANNSGGFMGGGMSVQVSSYAASIVSSPWMWRRSTWQGNVALKGGGIHLVRGGHFVSSPLTFDSCMWTNNTCYFNGGGVGVTSGGVRLDSSGATWRNCSWSGNIAVSGDGGGMNYEWQAGVIANGTEVVVTNASFVGNVAGANASLVGDAAGVADAGSLASSGRQSVRGGGAAFKFASDVAGAVNVTLSDLDAHENRIDARSGYGGAFSLLASGAHEIEPPLAPSADGNVYSSALWCVGALFPPGNPPPPRAPGRLIRSAVSFLLERVTIRGNGAVRGGRADAESEAAPTDDGRSVSGGGIAAGPSGVVSIVDSIVTDNVASASGMGGGVAVFGNSSMALSNVTLSLNIIDDRRSPLSASAAVPAAGQPATTSGSQLFADTTGDVTVSDASRVIMAGGAAGSVAAPAGGDTVTGGSVAGVGRADSTTDVQIYVSRASVPVVDAGAAASGLRIDCPVGTRLSLTNPFAVSLEPSTYSLGGLCGYGTWSLLAKCVPCPTLQFSLHHGTSLDGIDVKEAGGCRPCVFGADCEYGGGDIRALDGFWCDREALGAHADACDLCPAGACCKPAANSTSCSIDRQCAPGRAGRLCGSCAPGFSMTFGAARCVPDAACTDAGAFAVVVAAYALVYAGFLAATKRAGSSQAAADPAHDHRTRESGGGLFKAATYFGQMAAVVVAASGGASSSSIWRSWLTALLQLMELSLPLGGNDGSENGSGDHGTGGGLVMCPIVGLSPLGKVVAQYTLPLVVATGLGILHIGWLILARRGRRGVRAPTMPARGVQLSTMSLTSSGEGAAVDAEEDGRGRHDSGGLGAPLLADDAAAMDGAATPDSDEDDDGASQRSASSSASEDPVREPGGSPGSSPRVGFASVWASLLVFAYTKLALTTFALLHCVELASGERVLFRAGAHACDDLWWQPLVLFVGVVLAATPVLLVATSVWLSRHDGGGDVLDDADTSPTTRRRGRCGSAGGRVLRALLASLEKPYRSGWRRHWWAVQMLHRLVLVLLATFLVASPLAQMYFMVLVCVLALAAHMTARPYHSRTNNTAQGILLLCLVCVAMIGLAPAALKTASVPGASVLYQDSVDAAVVLRALLVGLPLLGSLSVVAWHTRVARSARRIVATRCCRRKV